MATATAPVTPPFLPEEILEEIFLRLPTAADLARASVACSSSRSVITGHSFLRRFRTLHPPPLLGIISTASFFPAQPPHPSAAAARTLAGADFSCSFLPSPERWQRHDFRDGRALMAAVPVAAGTIRSPHYYDPRHLDHDFAVCDPLHRRYVLLPAIPDDLITASVHQQDVSNVERFLSPSGEDAVYTSFTVMCLVECRTKLVLFSFSSGLGQWQAVTFDGWDALVAGSVYCQLCYRYCVRGCFCWPMPEIDKMLMLDTRSMEFSCIGRPPGPGTRRAVFVEAREGRLGMFTLPDDDELEFAHVLRYDVLRSEGEGPNQWQSEATILLPLGSHYKAMGVAGGYLLLQVIPEDFYSVPSPERPDLDCFTVNLHTLELEWFCGIRHTVILPDLYAGFPPSLSLPTI